MREMPRYEPRNCVLVDDIRIRLFIYIRNIKLAWTERVN